jgi:EAL and modified HD-GYP domain-containing signal transduction protein
MGVGFYMQELTNLIARQAICNRQLKVKGFELLYRMQMTTDGDPLLDNPDGASIDVLLATFNSLSIHDVVGDKLVFINFTSNILKHMPVIPHKQLVIELLEDQEITPKLLKSLSRLRQQGYKIALDDFCLNKESISLVNYADIIKIDVLATTPETWVNYIPKLQKKGITLLAEKVETYEMFERCCELGFDLFQGYYFAKPKIIKGRRISNNELSVLQLVSKLSAIDIDIDDVTNVIIRDPTLTYNLLRTINSGLFYLSTEIVSIKHAITMLGINRLQKWIALLALTTLEKKPQVLVVYTMIRARMCELLGQKITLRESADDYFTLGLMSLMDAFVNLEMDELLKNISLPKHMEIALLKHEGDMGKVLTTVINYQNGHWDCAQKISFIDDENIKPDDITQAYLDSVQWAEKHNHP